METLVFEGGGSAHGCAGGAQEQRAQEQRAQDLAAARARLFEDMRLLGEQHAVIMWSYAMVWWLALVRLMRVSQCAGGSGRLDRSECEVGRRECEVGRRECEVAKADGAAGQERGVCLFVYYVRICESFASMSCSTEAGISISAYACACGMCAAGMTLLTFFAPHKKDRQSLRLSS